MEALFCVEVSNENDEDSTVAEKNLVSIPRAKKNGGCYRNEGWRADEQEVGRGEKEKQEKRGRYCLKREITHAAAAAKISCLLALVNAEMTAEKSKVDTSKIPTQMAFSLPASSTLDETRCSE